MAMPQGGVKPQEAGTDWGFLLRAFKRVLLPELVVPVASALVWPTSAATLWNLLDDNRPRCRLCLITRSEVAGFFGLVLRAAVLATRGHR